jgi:dethiobiotin synthetase
MRPGEVTPVTFGPAVSPHLAAQLEGARIEPADLVAHARALGEPLVAEGVGGLLVPLTTGYSVRDLAVDLALPLVIAARPGLGTINHTLLTIEAGRAAGLEVRCVVLTPWPGEPSVMERSNRATIEQLGGVPVHSLPHVSPAALPADLTWV